MISFNLSVAFTIQILEDTNPQSLLGEYQEAHELALQRAFAWRCAREGRSKIELRFDDLGSSPTGQAMTLCGLPGADATGLGYGLECSAKDNER